MAVKKTTTTKTATTKTADGAKAPGKGEIAADLKGLVSTLKGDLTKLAGTKASSAIGKWESLLGSVGPGVKGVQSDLAKLKEQVGGETPDGKAIARTLGTLSTKTAKVAEGQGGMVGAALKSLATALSQASTSLKGGAKPPKPKK